MLWMAGCLYVWQPFVRIIFFGRGEGTLFVYVAVQLKMHVIKPLGEI